MTDVYTAALLLTKPSSDDDSGLGHCFGAEGSLPLNQSAPAVTHDTTRLCCIDLTQLDCHIHADAVIFGFEQNATEEHGERKTLRKERVDIGIIFCMHFLLPLSSIPSLP